MKKFTLTIGLAEHGRAEVVDQNSEELLDALLNVDPDGALVVFANLDSGVLSVAIDVHAGDADGALRVARPTISAGLEASGLQPIDIVHIDVSPSEVEEPDAVPA